MTHPELDEATRARIRAEERERMTARAELEAEQRLRSRPSYWTGVLLNLLVSGAGLMYAREATMGLLWLVGTLALVFLVSPWVAWPVGVVGSLLHYNSVYDRLYEPEAQAAAEAQRQGRVTGFLVVMIVILMGVAFLVIETRP